LPEEKLSGKEKKELEEARKEIPEDSGINLEDLTKGARLTRLFQVITSQTARKSIKKLPDDCTRFFPPDFEFSLYTGLLPNDFLDASVGFFENPLSLLDQLHISDFR